MSNKTKKNNKSKSTKVKNVNIYYTGVGSNPDGNHTEK
jgi:hypothetical protein